MKQQATTLLLDTHVLLWWWICPRLITPRVLERLQDPEQAVLVSVASLLELSQTHQRGLLPELSPVIWHLPELIRQERFQLLEISADAIRWRAPSGATLTKWKEGRSPGVTIGGAP